jgi:hypothetical protein
VTAARRFPPPWTVEALEEYLIVRDAHEQALGYFYFDEKPHRRAVNKRADQGRGAAHGQLILRNCQNSSGLYYFSSGQQAPNDGGVISKIISSKFLVG